MENNSLLPAIIIPAYQRPQALHLLLESLNSANYPSAEIPLIISLEQGSTKEVIELAEKFEFTGGHKRIIRAEKKMGLKTHLLTCGDYSTEFGSVIVLEDDLMVAPGFYKFATGALNFYRDREDKIAGISLYAQRFNETALLPFEPMPSPFSVYFMQLASSWGVAWSAKQWIDFKLWLSHFEHSDKKQVPEMPHNIKKWPLSSWKKLFDYYLIERNKFFVYPYQSYTTNNSGFGGTNMDQSTGNLFQVPFNLHYKTSCRLNFSDNVAETVWYDAYMEQKLSSVLPHENLDPGEIELDLYGSKTDSALKYSNYIISSKTGSKPLQSFPLVLKPIELNLWLSPQPNKAPFFHLYHREQFGELRSLTKYQYFQLAEHLSYFPFRTKFFLGGYISAVLMKLKSRFLSKS